MKDMFTMIVQIIRNILLRTFLEFKVIVSYLLKPKK